MSEYQHVTIGADVTLYRHPHDIEIAARCGPYNIGWIWPRTAPTEQLAEFLREHAAADPAEHGPQVAPTHSSTRT